MNLWEKTKLWFSIFNIKRAVKSKIKGICIENFWIDIYGSYYINPNNLVLLIAVQTDTLKSNLILNQGLKKDIKDIFIKYQFPIDSIGEIQIYFESQETVNQESKGDWHIHLQ
jgi:hypothetical protein